MTAVIIDDENHCITTLVWTLKEYCPDVNVIGTAKNGESGLRLIIELKPELVFLDVEMPVLNGIDMLNRMENVFFKVIFTTAYNHYAIKAIKLSAVDYLLKPVDKDELIEAVKKASGIQLPILEDDKINTLKHNINSVTSMQKIIVPSLEGIFFFDISTIVHLEAQSNYTMIYFENGTKTLSSKTLKDYEDALPDDIFFRCHHSYLINLRHIKKYLRGDGGHVELSHGMQIEVSRRKKVEFLAKVGL